MDIYIFVSECNSRICSHYGSSGTTNKTQLISSHHFNCLALRIIGHAQKELQLQLMNILSMVSYGIQTDDLCGHLLAYLLRFSSNKNQDPFLENLGINHSTCLLYNFSKFQSSVSRILLIGSRINSLSNRLG